ncbi:hypothetical protein [Dactylosporangium vinaceum]|uniref:Transcriptional regulator n=1 Tax=Dactylosporangium vinaceum TaxID=53362 RepID=A0ABV5ME33_9ACTN|nr:hypothetical protein [Dactylosporangium vinaceum]
MMSELLVLHAVRLKGFADTAAVAARFGLEPAQTEEDLLDAEAYGLVSRSAFADLTGWSLTERGRKHNEALLRAELDSTGARSVVAAVHERFVPLNAEASKVFTAWQLQPARGAETRTAHGSETAHNPETGHGPDTAHTPGTAHNPESTHSPGNGHGPETAHRHETAHSPEHGHGPQNGPDAGAGRRPDVGGAPHVGEHLGALYRLADALSSIEGALTPHLARFGGYHARFTLGLRNAERDPAWITGIDVDSCHSVWFELHEDLVATLGIVRV